MGAGHNFIYTDTGGTFTDCVIVTEGGKVLTGKAPTTPERLEDCFFQSIQAAAGDELRLEEVL